jgi:7-cyano-7-deazaguanine reductase
MTKRKIKKKSYQGLQNNVRVVNTPSIGTWRNQYPDREYTITIKTNEFSCICPKTGLPDFADVVIDYIPNKYCVELKSFKLYLVFFRNLGIFHEHATNRILDDFIQACKPRSAKITAEFSVRGGIKTTVSREYEGNIR